MFRLYKVFPHAHIKIYFWSSLHNTEGLLSLQFIYDQILLLQDQLFDKVVTKDTLITQRLNSVSQRFINNLRIERRTIQKLEDGYFLSYMVIEIPSMSAKLGDISTKSHYGGHYSLFCRSRELKRLVK